MWKLIIDWLYEMRDPRIYSNNAPTLRADRFGLLVVNIEEEDANTT